jgi:hypothetical protein
MGAHPKIDPTIYTQQWCQNHRHLSGPELGRLMGVDETSARAYLDRMGVERPNRRVSKWHKMDCRTCGQQCDPNGLEDTPCMVAWPTELEDLLAAEQRVDVRTDHERVYTLIGRRVEAEI